MIKEYKTQDIVLAATLKLNNFSLKDIRKDGNKGIFIFENVTSKFIADYDLGKVSVEPIDFNNTIKHLTTSVRGKWLEA